MIKNDFFDIGIIANTHGIKGELKILPTTDDPARFELLDTIDVYRNNVKQTYTVERCSFHKQFVMLKLAGIDDMTEAERLKGGVIKVARADAIPLSDDEYYFSDLYNMEVFLEDGTRFGVLHDILETGANDVYIVKTDEKDVLIPAIKDCIIRVSVAENKMTIRLLEGLI